MVYSRRGEYNFTRMYNFNKSKHDRQRGLYTLTVKYITTRPCMPLVQQWQFSTFAYSLKYTVFSLLIPPSAFQHVVTNLQIYNQILGLDNSPFCSNSYHSEHETFTHGWGNVGPHFPNRGSKLVFAIITRDAWSQYEAEMLTFNVSR